MIILHSHGVGRGLSQSASNAAAEPSKTLERLSTGSRINHAKDDAARLGVSENLDSASRSKRVAIRNLEDAMSLTQTAEGGLQGISEHMKRARELAVQAASETLTDTERAYVQDEFQRQIGAANDIANTTEYNTMPLLAFSTVDVGLIVDVSFSMNQELTEVKSSINNFVSTLAQANLQAGLGLASMGPDLGDGVTRLADISADNFAAELSGLSIAGGLSMDPYSTIMQTAGLNDINGNDDPDAFNWRAGTQRKTLVMVTDTFRETFYSTDTEPSTATAIGDAEIEVHTINRPVHNSFYDDITSAANGQMHDIGDNFGSGVQSAFDDIAAALSDDYGITTLSVQSSDRAGSESLISINLPLDATTVGLGLTTTNVSTVADARSAIEDIDAALTTVSGHRSTAAATTNRIQQALDAETRASADIKRAKEDIVSADIASETAEAAREQTKAQATQAVLAQSTRIQRSAIDSLLTP